MIDKNDESVTEFGSLFTLPMHSETPIEILANYLSAPMIYRHQPRNNQAMCNAGR